MTRSVRIGLAALALATGPLAAQAADLPDPPWFKAPSFADFAAAYPQAAKAQKVSGRVELDCAFIASGQLGRCDVLSERPAGQGFGAAARKVAQGFVGPTQLSNGRTITGSHTNLVINFSPDMLDQPKVALPQWTALPTPAQFQSAFPDAASKAGVLKAKVVMTCTVAADGGLTGCGIASEDPPGYGFGPATLPLAPAFRVKLWGTDGRPVVGGTVRAPIRYDLQQAADPAAPKP